MQNFLKFEIDYIAFFLYVSIWDKQKKIEGNDIIIQKSQ